MLFVLEIEMNNAAFETNRNMELAVYLKELADKIQSEPETTMNFGVRDVNGNMIGAAEFFPDS